MLFGTTVTRLSFFYGLPSHMSMPPFNYPLYGTGIWVVSRQELHNDGD